MGMTEKQGGSDVRSNTTMATALADGVIRWSETSGSSPRRWAMAAGAGAGVGRTELFLLPRRMPDGAKNAFRLLRPKDKLGDWSNASSEVEFTGAWARRIGEEAAAWPRSSKW